MSTFEVPNLDRDPRTGHFQPGHSISNLAAKTIAKKMADLKAAYISAVDPGDSALVCAAHMECLTQTKDMKLKLAAVALWYDRNFGKPTEHININSEATTSGTLAVLSRQLDPVDLGELERILAKLSPPEPVHVIEQTPAVKPVE